MQEDLDITDLPSVFVVKEEKNYKFREPNAHEDLSRELESFIKNDQFLSFTPVSITNFHNLIESQKIILILLIDSTHTTISKK